MLNLTPKDCGSLGHGKRSWLLDEVGVSDTPYVYSQLTYPHVRTGLRTYSPAYSIEVAVEEAMLEVDTSEAIEEVIGETIVESNATHT